jgi:cytochrome P450
MEAAPSVRISPETLRKNYRQIFQDLAGRGDLVWVDTREQRFLLVNSPAHVQEMLVDRAAALVKPDSQLIETGPPAPAPADDDVPVPEFRAALSRGMGNRRIPDVLAGITSAVDVETQGWHDGAYLPLMQMMRRLSINSMCRASFGSSFSASETDQAERALAATVRGFQVNTRAARRMDRWKFDRRRRKQGYMALDALSGSLIANADLSRPSELTATLHDLPRLAPSFTDAQIHGMITELFVGAVDPMAQTAAWTLFRFATETEAAARLRDEWDAVLTAGEPLDRAALGKLRYTEAFVREVTRLHPTNDRITRQAIEDTSIGGENVPTLARVILNVNALHRDPRFHEDPERFAPERWLDGRAGSHKFAYVAFGVGGRRCLGETMGVTSLIALLPALAHDWDFEFGKLRISKGARSQPAENTKLTLRARSS